VDDPTAPQEMGEARRVAGGIWSIRVPVMFGMLSGRLNGTRAYVLECDGGFVLIDTGWHIDEAWDALLGGIEAAGFALTDCLGVLLTHSHPDHHGLSARVRDATGCWLAMHPAEAELVTANNARGGAPSKFGFSESFFHAGAPQERYAELPQIDVGSLMPPSALPDRLLGDGHRADVPGRTVECVWTPGHAIGHLAFWLPEESALLTGDHILPRISPYIGMWGLDEGDPLGDYLDSLRRLRRWDAEVVLPGHGDPLDIPLAQRVDELIGHHENHLSAIESRAAEGSATLWELAAAMPWKRGGWNGMPSFLQGMALGEVRAHVQHCEATGRLQRAEDGPPVRWSATRSAA
jgi:glyoxylase-like metal-dependent hydrolase (beta-lactamase superfamily II)